MVYTVSLEDGTTGTISSDELGSQDISCFLNKEIEINLFDENGESIQVIGKLIDILEEKEDWE